MDVVNADIAVANICPRQQSAPTSIVVLELIPVSLLTTKQSCLWKLAEAGGYQE